MEIQGRRIGKEYKPYLIAEMSGNHNNSLERALEIVDAAAVSGADAIKLQTYTPDTMTLDSTLDDFVIQDPSSIWYGRNLYELYAEAHTPWEWHEPIIERANLHGLACFSTPFDSSSVDFLESLGVPAYKIASFELVDLSLIERVASTGKPVILSTGMATVSEISEAVAAARKAGLEDVVILKCTSTYPASPESTNLSTIANMRQTFGCEVGLSDHTMGCGVAVGAVALGAVLIEKHFTLDRDAGGVDSTFSMEPSEFLSLRQECDRAWMAIGNVVYGGTESEEGSRAFRRSLYITEDLKVGDILTPSNLRAIRPGYGLSPKFLDMFIGRSVARNVSKGTRLDWSVLFPD